MQEITNTQVINITGRTMNGIALNTEGVKNVDDVHMLLNHLRYTWDMAPEVPAMYCANALRKAAEIQERTGSAESAEYAHNQWQYFIHSYGLA
jgi:hypothetical protein